jgi:hypothetical protein
VAVEVFSHPLQQGAHVAAGHGQVQDIGIEIFLGDDHDIQGGNGLGCGQPQALAHHAFDPISGHGVADLLADGHAQTPRDAPLRARQDKQKEKLPMVAAARFEAGREFLLLSDPVRRRKA